MNTKTLEYIIAIAEERSISKAADRFLLSQADLSRHLKKVETKIGVKLFTRTPKGVEITQAGIIFINDARSILHLENKLDQDLTAMRSRARHTIRVMIDEPLYSFFVRTASPRFLKLHPDWKLDFQSCNAVQVKRAIQSGKADFGVFYSSVSRSSEMEYLVFDIVPSYLVFPKDFPKKPDLLSMKEALAGGMSIALYPVGSTGRMIQEEHLIQNGIYPEKIMEGNGRGCITHVSQDDACGILPARFCTADTRARITVGDTFYTSNVVIAYSKKIPPSPAEQDLMQIIISDAPR